ncbi:MAG: peptidoglycan-associated lipoprotein Pal [Nitrospinae bacterium]|nr:peptidoglycan-associated lipoprotein Pal [Nitrospinota bacterium]
MRIKNRLLVAMAVFSTTVIFSLSACSTAKKETLPAAGEAGAGTGEGAGGMTAEERLQQGQRDVAYTDESQLSDVYFDFDKSDIRPEARDVLQKNADWMKANPNAKVQIEGHCDERGTEEYNLALGERRANSVKNYIISLGVPAEKLYTISYGEELPIDPGHTEDAWAKNRRAHFLVTK